MKLRFTALILSIFMLIPCALSACNSGETAETTAPEVEETNGATSTAEATEAVTTAEETTTEECMIIVPPKSIKILAIGNSFSSDRAFTNVRNTVFFKLCDFRFCGGG